MTQPTSIDELRESISFLEIKQAEDARLLKVQFSATCENLKPINLLQNSIKGFTDSKEFNENLLQTVVSITAGYFSKKLFIGSTNGPLKKLLGAIVQLGITSLVAKKADGIKLVVTHLINIIFNRKK